ncbi:3-hydroxyacyl-CoA dehydrogenase NAD-binding domain-containing protein [Brevibacterium album]|uniref:3-hydroxyacyl-CoA dehydrogenase NAD-binding domain-containing protein n=1 Tax=Brevibacterium album TaxID=417948 RepID=UPI0003FA5754|nr:3-hydroxyacyl-CoA dehydrogenase NAD-binding domain-containing protein [Brevibacterium album]
MRIPTSETVTWRREGEAAVVEIASPPVNALGDTVRAGLHAAFDAIAADGGVAGLVLIGTGRGFCGGADVRRFGTPAAAAQPDLRAVFGRLAALEIPTVAAIHGFALGGGLELALAANYRIAAIGSSIGLSETTLGLIPAGGGTQRLPRLIGAAPALELILAGSRLSAEEACARGILDEVFTDEPATAGLAFLLGVLDRARTGESPAHPCLDTAPAPDAAGLDLEAARSRAARSRRNSRAQLAAIDAVEASLTLPFEKGLDRERALSLELKDGPESTALRHLFFAERTAARLAGPAAEAAARDLRTAAVIGSGTMGCGIAMALASAGLPVTVVDTTDEALGRARKRVEDTYRAQAAKGRIEVPEAAARTARIALTTDMGEVAAADIVIEAVFEDMDVKRGVFAQLDGIAQEGAVLATNTSRLDVDRIAEATARPQDVIGLHFFSPADVMRLLEVVQGARTAEDVLATAMALAARIGKQPVLSQVGEGFIGNRMLSPYKREAEQLLEQGATPAQVDAAMEAFGFAMGPFAVGDLAGLDVGEAGRRTFRASATPEQMESFSEIPTRLFEAGRYGQKTGAGYYRYVPGDRTRHEDPAVAEIIAQCAAESGAVRREVPDEEIVERCLLALVNEGAKVLGEGIAQRPGDLDVVWVHGYGFPAFRGGPMHWAEQRGWPEVVERLRAFERTIGAYWAPAPWLLEQAAGAGA